MRMKDTPREWDHIQRIRQMVQRQKAGTLIPLGDDAFVTTAPTQALVMAQDMMIEDVHFRLLHSSAADLGYKALAVNLSDFAAMGATPRWAQVSLGLPSNLKESWLDEFYKSMTALADQYGVEIVGGDLCASPKAVVIDVSLCGEAAHAISRQKAQAGDWLWCSGPLGISARGLRALEQNEPPRSETQQAIAKHLRPTPRLDLLPDLQKYALDIHALIDVSDGLISESLHLTRHLQIGLDLFMENLESGSTATRSEILWGGEDYELLMALPADFSANLSYENTWLKQWRLIGQFNSSKEIGLVFNHQKPDQSREVLKEFKGWQHFNPVSI